MFCVNCGRRKGEVELFTIGQPGDVLSPDLKTCLPCLSKYGIPKLQQEANSAFATHKLNLFSPSEFQLKCAHCDEGFVFWQHDGRRPIYCRACNRRRLRHMTEAGVI